VLNKIDEASGPATANRVRTTLSSCFSWAMREGLAPSNPVAYTNKRQEGARERVLSEDEVRCIWNATSDNAYGTIVRLLILTGQRRSEIGEMRWSEVALDRCSLNLSGERTKNKRSHVVPLAPTALALLDRWPRSGEMVFKFAAWGYSKALLDERSGVRGWVLHDIRRTVATGMADIGIQPHIIEAVLNHVSGHKGGIAGIYIAHSMPVRRNKRWRGGTSTCAALSVCGCVDSHGRQRQKSGPLGGNEGAAFVPAKARPCAGRWS
jgi:integrase